MFTLNCKGRLLLLNDPWVMGVINLTPDSFFAGSRFEEKEKVIRQVEKMLNEGAEIIDIGAQSTRPNAELLSADQELKRIAELVYFITERFPGTVVSVDTFYSRVAQECVQAGALMVNDISGGNMDENMLAVMGKLNVPYVCMHMKGTPRTMMQHSTYENLAEEMTDYFVSKLELCRQAGIKDVILDPGFGFSKNTKQNFELLGKLGLLKIFGKPLLAGLSRKSTIYKTLGVTPAEALNGTTVLNTIALMNGATILRVHDVKEAKECVKLFGQYRTQ